MSSAQLHNGLLNLVHRYIIAPHRTLIGHYSSRTLRYLHETIPYMVNHLTDRCKYLHFSGVTDMFGLGVCSKFENPIIPPSNLGKIHRTEKIYSFMRSWRRSSSITFIIDNISLDQYFR